MVRCWVGGAMPAGPMALRITKQGLEAVGLKDDALAAPTETSIGSTPMGAAKHLPPNRSSPSGILLPRRARPRSKRAPRAKAGQAQSSRACDAEPT